MTTRVSILRKALILILGAATFAFVLGIAPPATPDAEAQYRRSTRTTSFRSAPRTSFRSTSRTSSRSTRSSFRSTSRTSSRSTRSSFRSSSYRSRTTTRTSRSSFRGRSNFRSARNVGTRSNRVANNSRSRSNSGFRSAGQNRFANQNRGNSQNRSSNAQTRTSSAANQARFNQQRQARIGNNPGGVNSGNANSGSQNRFSTASAPGTGNRTATNSNLTRQAALTPTSNAPSRTLTNNSGASTARNSSGSSMMPGNNPGQNRNTNQQNKPLTNVHVGNQPINNQATSQNRTASSSRNAANYGRSANCSTITGGSLGSGGPRPAGCGTSGSSNFRSAAAQPAQRINQPQQGSTRNAPTTSGQPRGSLFANGGTLDGIMDRFAAFEPGRSFAGDVVIDPGGRGTPPIARQTRTDRRNTSTNYLNDMLANASSRSGQARLDYLKNIDDHIKRESRNLRYSDKKKLEDNLNRLKEEANRQVAQQQEQARRQAALQQEQQRLQQEAEAKRKADQAAQDQRNRDAESRRNIERNAVDQFNRDIGAPRSQ